MSPAASRIKSCFSAGRRLTRPRPTSAGIKPQPDGIDDDFCERGDILEPHIESLARDRVDHMGGIAHEGEAIGNESARH